MDIKSFSDDNFDPKKWINKAWSTSGNQDKEVFVENSISRLQLYMKQLTNSLDETTTQIVSSIPRILQDAHTLELEGAVLQQNIQNLEQKVVGVEEETGQSIKSLQRIDQLKSRLENAASSLREADKWAALVSALEDTLSNGVPTKQEDLAELTERVAAMTASLEVLSDAPDYETKRFQLEALYNRLEAAVNAPLMEALKENDADRVSSYVSLFVALGRHDSLVRNWRVSATPKHVRDAYTLDSLGTDIADNAHRQLEWLSDVLKSETPLAELVKLYTDMLTNMDPTPTKVLTANMKVCGGPEDCIVFLTDVRTQLDQLAAMFENLLSSPKYNKEKVDDHSLRNLGKALYAPLRELLPKYAEIQSQVFLGQLQTTNLEQGDLLERSKALQTLVERCENWLNNSLSIADKIGGVAALPYYVVAVETLSTSVHSRASSLSRKIEATLSCPALGSVGEAVSFPAARAVASAVGTLLDVEGKLLEKIGGMMSNETPSTSPLRDTIENLLDTTGKQLLSSLRTNTEPLPSMASLRRAADTLRTMAVNILTEPVHRELEKIPNLPVWSNNDPLATDLPDYALSPQEYITEVGQYLMTLPQHLEMHLSEKQAPWQFLTEVCNFTCETLADKLLNIKNMDALGTKRCLTDIVYLSNVVEDLGSSITPSLKNLEKSLRSAAPQQTSSQS